MVNYENTEEIENQEGFEEARDLEVEDESGEMGSITSKTVMIENNSNVTVNLYF